MSSSWRHKTRFRPKKKLFRGRETTGFKLPIDEQHYRCLVVIKLTSQLSPVTTIEFDHHIHITPTGAILRFDLRREHLIIEKLDSNKGCKHIYLTEKANVILHQVEKLKSEST